jgi:nicotinate-nucleotide adenylyltransferase
MARAAVRVLGLDVVYMTPALRPPHKSCARMSPWETRVEMTRLAASGMPGIDVSLQEEDTPGISYTVELLRRFRRRCDGDLYFIMGADSLRDMSGWMEPEAILALATIVVFPRSGIEPVLELPGDASIVVFESPVVDVSSSGIREKCRAGEPIWDLVPESVREYIVRNSLYTH